MSCGAPPTGSSGGFDYRQHPRRCFYSEDGSGNKSIILVGIRWTEWGTQNATASAWRVDTHDQDNNGFQRHPVEIAVSGLRPVMSDQGQRKLYYSRLRVYFSEDEVYTMRLHWPKRRQPQKWLSTRDAAQLMREALSRNPKLSFAASYSRKVKCGRRVSRSRVRCRVSWITGDLYFKGAGTIWLAHEGRGTSWNYAYRVRMRNAYCQATGAGNCVETITVR